MIIAEIQVSEYSELFITLIYKNMNELLSSFPFISLIYLFFHSFTNFGKFYRLSSLFVDI